MAATIATYAEFLGFLIENYEPIAWAETSNPPAPSTTPALQRCT